MIRQKKHKFSTTSGPIPCKESMCKAIGTLFLYSILICPMHQRTETGFHWSFRGFLVIVRLLVLLSIEFISNLWMFKRFCLSEQVNFEVYPVRKTMLQFCGQKLPFSFFFCLKSRLHSFSTVRIHNHFLISCFSVVHLSDNEA